MINNTINITREVTQDSDGTYNYETFRSALRAALETNFYSILKRNKINTISDIEFNSDKDVIISVSSTSNEIYINRMNSENDTIAIIQYNPYISYIKYRQFVNESTSELSNGYKPVATILLNIVIDSNISGFSLLSPADLQLLDADSNLYGIKANTNVTNSYDNVQYDSQDEIDISSFPEIIKLQSKIIYDDNSYYELSCSNINTPYDTVTLPCVNSVLYDNNNNSYSFKSLFNSLYANFNESTSDSVIGNVLLLPKMLCSSNVVENTVTISNNLQGYTNTVFDCPELDIGDYWNPDNTFNFGDVITIGDSDYIISNKNTLIQLANTEIYAISKTFIYDGKPHMFDIVYPDGAKVYYRESGISTAEWIELPADLTTITTYTEAQTYSFDYKVEITENSINKEYYGNVQLIIENATQYGYLVEAYNGSYNALPHSLYIYTDATVEYSLDQNNWSSVAPVFTSIGTYKVYYRLVKNNYNTVTDSVDIIIDNISTDELETLNFDIDISKNIIIMREQLYSNVNSTLFIEASDNNVLVSNTHPNYINVNNFIGQFPEPTADNDTPSSILGSFTVSPGIYYLVIEAYMPWYYQGVEPTLSNTQMDSMVTNNPVSFSIDYYDGLTENISFNSTGWNNVVNEAIPSNGFYEYKITNIEGHGVGKLWDSTGAMDSVKRLLVKLDLTSLTSSDSIKTIRIICNHTKNVNYTEGTSLPFNSTITSTNLGVALINLTKFNTPTTINYTNVNYNGSTYAQIPIKFKSQLNSDAYFAFNVGNNLEYSGVGYINKESVTLNGTTFPGVDSNTGIYDNQGITLWKNGTNASMPGNMYNNWTPNSYYTIIKDTLTRIQFNPKVEEHTVPRTNIDNIFSYINCL